MVLIGHRASGIGHRALLNSLGTKSHRASELSSHLSSFISFISSLKFLYHFKHSSSIISLNNLYVIDYFKSIQSKLAQRSLFIFFILLTIHPAQALSTTTAKAIEGSAPEVINIDLAANKQGFTVNGVFYSEASNNIKGNEVKEFSGELSPENFIVKNFYYNSLDNTLNYADKDGDGIDTSKPFLLSLTSKQWYDGNGKLITDTSKTMGCGSSYPMPLTLEITTQVKTYSKYGMPRESDYVPIVKRYQIAPKSKICYAAPYSLVSFPDLEWRMFDANGTLLPGWRSSGSHQSHPLYGGGYNDDYIANKGFRADPIISSRKFPTTGFVGAQFQLVMTGAQSDYDFSLLQNPGNGASIDHLGNIRLNNKPTGPIQVRTTLRRKPTVVHDYIFDPTTVWVEPQKTFIGNWSEAKNQCGGSQYMLTRSELTNSPQSKVSGPLLWQYHDNTFTRAIGQGLLPEWGTINADVSYPGSSWTGKTHYWTNEVDLPNYSHFLVVGHDGNVSIGIDSRNTDLRDSTIELRVVCKK
ncbi:hypothetical protein [Gilliamella sp. wkB171]|uniref:hypothetical protein n=1 Tax=Gilliamella sp. wkB171 TaxID=3120258 RepID=UPI000813BD06|nr:hypothetical protein [Gilliamella apicola]OCL16349.1 hypothetical protein A9G03_12175 [Gilliamella apicola]